MGWVGLDGMWWTWARVGLGLGSPPTTHSILVSATQPHNQPHAQIRPPTQSVSTTTTTWCLWVADYDLDCLHVLDVAERPAATGDLSIAIV